LWCKKVNVRGCDNEVIWELKGRVLEGTIYIYSSALYHSSPARGNASIHGAELNNNKKDRKAGWDEGGNSKYDGVPRSLEKVMVL